MSNTFEKSANIAMVNSPLFIALMMSFLKRNSIVDVECPLLYPEIFSLSILCLSMYSIIWLSTRRSYTFENTGRIAIGLYSSHVLGLSTCGTGDILDIFHAFGKVFRSMRSFIMLVSGEVMYSVTGLIYLAGIKSGPVAQSVLIFLFCRSTSLKVTLRNIKESLSF